MRQRHPLRGQGAVREGPGPAPAGHPHRHRRRPAGLRGEAVDGQVQSVSVEMGRPRLLRQEIPMAGPASWAGARDQGHGRRRRPQLHLHRRVHGQPPRRHLRRRSRRSRCASWPRATGRRSRWTRCSPGAPTSSSPACEQARAVRPKSTAWSGNAAWASPWRVAPGPAPRPWPPRWRAAGAATVKSREPARRAFDDLPGASIRGLAPLMRGSSCEALRPWYSRRR